MQRAKYYPSLSLKMSESPKILFFFAKKAKLFGGIASFAVPLHKINRMVKPISLCQLKTPIN